MGRVCSTLVRLAAFSITTFLSSVATAPAQQITGAPGSPSATTTVDGRFLPNPPPAFGGEIGLDAKDSKTFWPPQIVPPKGAPNILLIMTDDAGYGVAGTFGGVIPTPALDRVAQAGLRYTQFHSTALCSPSRAALYQVFPLDNDVLGRTLAARPSATAGRNLFTYAGVIQGIPTSDAPNILNKS